MSRKLDTAIPRAVELGSRCTNASTNSCSVIGRLNSGVSSRSAAHSRRTRSACASATTNGSDGNLVSPVPFSVNTARMNAACLSAATRLASFSDTPAAVTTSGVPATRVASTTPPEVTPAPPWCKCNLRATAEGVGRFANGYPAYATAFKVANIPRVSLRARACSNEVTRR